EDAVAAERDVRPAHRIELPGAGLEAQQAFSGVRTMRRAALALASLLAVTLAPIVLAQTPQPSATPASMAEYLVKLAEYDAARAAYQLRAGPYWAEVKAKRAARAAKRRAHREITLDDYVLTQPPDYTGPKKPINPAATVREVPVVGDYLQHAQRKFEFVPERPATGAAITRAFPWWASAPRCT